MKTLRRVILAEENRLRRQADAAITQAARTEYGSKPVAKTAAEEDAQEKQTIRHNAGSDIATSRIRSRIYGRGLAKSMARGRVGPRVTSAESLRLGRMHADERRAAQDRAAQAVVSHTAQPLTAGRVFMFESDTTTPQSKAAGRRIAGMIQRKESPAKITLAKHAAAVEKHTGNPRKSYVASDVVLPRNVRVGLGPVRNSSKSRIKP